MAVKDRLYGVPVLGTALRVQDRYKEDAADQFAAAIGFFGFLSVFPLMLIAVAVAGFVLRGDPAAQNELVGTIVDAIPGFAAAIGDDRLGELVDSITQNAGAIGAVGAVTLLLSGLRVVNAAMTATQRVFRVDVEVSGVKVKLRQVGALTGLGLIALAGAAATAALGVAVRVDVTSAMAVLATVASVALSVLLDLVLFLVAYRVLAAGEGPGFRRLWPGALLAAIAWTGLKAFGATYVSGQVAKADELYGVFGGVIALLLLFYLAGRIYLYGAELAGLLYDPGRDLAARDDQVEYRGGTTEPDDETATRDGAASPAGHDTSEGHAAADLADVGAGTAAFPEDPEAERVRIAPTAHEPSPIVSETTRDRVAIADRARGERRADVRGALAFVIAIAAVGGLVRFFRPWETDD